MPFFYTPTGAHTAVETGEIPIRYNPGGLRAGVKIAGNKKDFLDHNGRRFLREPAIVGDVAFIRAWKVDEVGNCVFRYGLSRENEVGNYVYLLTSLYVGIPRTISRDRWLETPS